MKSDATEYTPIIRKLLEKTRQGRVEWSAGLPRNSFTCSLGGAATLGTIHPNNERFWFTIEKLGIEGYRQLLTMRDQAENQIFQVESNDLPTSSQEEETSVLLDELYDLARRQALKVEQKLEVVSTLLDRV